MGPAIGQILPFAVGVAISPVPIIAVILILFTPLARRNGPAFAAGWVAALFLVCGITILVASGGDVATESTPSDAAYAVKFLLGAVLLLLALNQWRRRPGEGEASRMPGWMQTIDSFTPPKSFGMGVLLAGVNPKNLLLSVGSGLTIAQQDPSSAGALGALVAFVIVASATVAGPVLYYLLAGPTAEGQLDSLKAWLIQNNAAVMTVLLLIFGAVLIGQGFAGLTA